MEALILLAFCMTALSMPLRTYFPVFVKDIFRRGPETYGQLLSMMGVGSICGSLTIASLGNFRHKGRLALIMLVFLGAAISAFALSKSLTVSYAVGGLAGFAMMTVFATVTSLVQLITTEEMRGRVMSVYNCAFRGGMPMGNLRVGMAGADIHRSGRARSQWTPAGLARCVFLCRALACDRAVRESAVTIDHEGTETVMNSSFRAGFLTLLRNHLRQQRLRPLQLLLSDAGKLCPARLM